MTSLMDTSLAWATLASLALDMQGERLLRLRFPYNDAPAGATLLASSLDATESLSCDFCYVVEVLSDHAAIALESVMGKMVCIELVREDGSLRFITNPAVPLTNNVGERAVRFPRSNRKSPAASAHSPAPSISTSLVAALIRCASKGTACSPS